MGFEQTAKRILGLLRAKYLGINAGRNVYLGKHFNIKGGERISIGNDAVIVGDVHIGRHCIIGANSVVTRSIPNYSVAVGIPAKVIKKYSHEHKELENVNSLKL